MYDFGFFCKSGLTLCTGIYNFVLYLFKFQFYKLLLQKMDNKLPD